MHIYYVESELGCSLHLATSIANARAIMQCELGRYWSIKCIREATEADIEWVTAMGGYVPHM